MPTITRRHDIVVLFDVTNGNPNGDPDAGNLPRTDPETGHGLVTDVCIKRKLRNWAALNGERLFVNEGSVLSEAQREAYMAVRAGNEALLKEATKETVNPKDAAEATSLRNYMTSTFWDVRTFGAVMGTGVNTGQVRGPVQVSMARSIEPILPMDISITRMAATKASEVKPGGREENRTMGRKALVPYGLYRAHIWVSVPLAEQTGFSDSDLDLLITGLERMFENDHSAARGEMVTRKVVVFAHDSKLGVAPSHRLFERVRVTRATDVALPARSWEDYSVQIDGAELPAGVTMTVLG
ncbi:MAG: type I-C CRISPR-associated protein Cas7/Csd2 [Burkholderiales bacterium]|nr:type I-C CRISPR-associated protein Cas7/Csd2 [Burkholderiales bacterium]